MTKISQYSTDVNITGNDKWIGSDAQNYLITKNFTPNNLATYFNGNNVIDIGSSIRYVYQTLDPGEAREQGTISFETEIGPQVDFSAITTFLIAKNTLKGNTVTQYLDFLVDGKVLLSKASNINIFGYYKITSIEPWIPNTNFFVVTVDFLAGNGFIYEDLDYLVSLVDKVQDIPPPVWGSITGDIEDQTDLIGYISTELGPYFLTPLGTTLEYVRGDGSLATFPTIEIPTLQQVLDNNHNLVNGKNYQGTGAGVSNTGKDVNAFGQDASTSNTGDNQNAFGNKAGVNNTGVNQNAFGIEAGNNNTGDNVNAFGRQAGFSNTFNNVNLFGDNALADEDGQTVLSKEDGVMARLSTVGLTATRKYNFPNASGTIALTSDITIPSLQETITVNKTADEIELLNTFFSGGTFIPALTPPGFLLYAINISLAQSGGYYVYGNFNGYDGGASKGIVKILPNGGIDTSFATGTGLNNYPFSGTSLLEDDFGKLYLPGSFTTYNGVSSNRIVGLNSDGSINSSFNTGSGFNNYTVQTTFNVAKTAIYVTGSFSSYNGVSSSRFAKILLDGTLDPSFIIGTGFNTVTISVAVNSDDTLFVTTYGTTYKGAAIPNIIKLLPNGDRDLSFVSGTGFTPSGSGQANYILKTPDDKIIVAGTFTSYNGTAANKIIKLNQDGTVDTSFVVGTGFNGSNVFGIQLVDNDTKYLVSGDFTLYKGVATNSNVLIDLYGNIIETYVNQYEASLYINNALLTLAGTGPNAGDLIFVKDDVEYLELNQSLTFDKTNGKAEYNLSPNLIYDDLGENELVPKKFIPQSVAKTTSFIAINSGIYNTNGTITVTDPAPATNKGYTVYVIGGISTIGGVGYTTGALVYRFFNGTEWVSTYINPFETTTRYVSTFSATEGQTVFTTVQPLPVGYFDVYLNGVKINSFTSTDYTITLDEASILGDIIDIVSYNVLSLTSRDTRRNATDSVDSNINYCGVAPADSLEIEDVWTIYKIVVANDGGVATTSATDVAWTDREIIIYT